MTTDILRWGILGTGGIAHTFAHDIAALPDAHVVAVGSRTRAAAEAFAQEFAVLHTHTGEDPDVLAAELADDPEVDAVYIATPHPAHHRGALAAIAAGKAVLVEKPFTMDAAQAREIVQAARTAKVFCMEAMWTRFLPHILAVRSLLSQGVLGELRTVVADHGQRFAPDPAHRLFDPALGGGALLDLGIYPLSFASMVLGLPDPSTPGAVTAVADRAFTGVDAQTSAVLRYPGGAHAVLTTTMESYTPRRAWIAGTEGTIEIDPVFYAPTSFTLHRDDGHTMRYQTPAEVVAGPGKGLGFEAAEVARCLRMGLLESPAIPLDETVAIMTVMDEIRRQSS